MNPTLRRSLAVLWLLALPGCVTGPRPDALPPARTGQGVDVEFSTLPTPDGRTYERLRAELLEVRTNALLVRHQQVQRESLLLVSYRLIADARFEDLPRLRFGDGAAPSHAQREELRLLSRFPQGVSESLLRDLLTAYDQDTLRTIP
jgi:hypothetical protein